MKKSNRKLTTKKSPSSRAKHLMSLVMFLAGFALLEFAYTGEKWFNQLEKQWPDISYRLWPSAWPIWFSKILWGVAIASAVVALIHSLVCYYRQPLKRKKAS